MANIKNELNNIKSALYGKDVRGSIHDGIDAINKEVENTTGRQADLENTFDQLIINVGNSNAEIVDARVKNDGTSYSKLGDRLDGIDSQLTQNTLAIEDVMSYIEDNVENSTKDLSLGIQDGLLYLFNAGVPQGIGIDMPAQEVVGDVVGYINDDNVIILMGSLADGIYTMKYQYEDGTFSDAISVNVGDIPVCKNLLPEAQEEGLTGVYNGVGYKENIRWSGSSNAFISDKQCVLTGLIPIREYGDVFHVRGVDIVGYVNGRQSGWSHYYDENGDKLQMAVSVPATVIGTDVNGDFTITLKPSIMTSIPNGAVYVRFQFGEIVGDEFIISRNFLIP